MHADHQIRPYRAADRPALYDICLRTGADGQDATGRYHDPTLLAEVYLGAYLTFAPGLAFVLSDHADTPVGYAVGVADTLAFEATCASHWWPRLRLRHPDPADVPLARRTPDQRLAALVHHRPAAPAAIAARYPAHLHLDLLPSAQGQGWGRALLRHLLTALHRSGARGVHLGVASANTRALRFYRSTGFRPAETSPGGVTMVMPLPAPIR